MYIDGEPTLVRGMIGPCLGHWVKMPFDRVMDLGSVDADPDILVVYAPVAAWIANNVRQPWHYCGQSLLGPPPSFDWWAYFAFADATEAALFKLRWT